MNQDPAGVAPSERRDRPSELSTLAHDVVNLAARLMVLSANLQSRLAPADRDETTALLGDSTQRLQEIARKLRELGKDA